MRKLLLSSIILLMFSCKSTYIERGNSTWNVQTNTQDQKKTKSENHPNGNFEIIQKDSNAEELTFNTIKSNKLKPNIKTDIYFLKSTVKDKKLPSFKLEKPEIIKRANSQKSISDWFERFGAYNTLGEIGVWIMIVGSAFLTFGIALGGDNYHKWGGIDSFSIFQWSTVIGLGLLVLGFLLWAIGLAIFHWF